MDSSMKRKLLVVLVLLIAVTIAGCGPAGSRLLSEPLDAEEVTGILVVLAMGNPEYGADSKMIENRGEIDALVASLNGASIGARVNDMDLAVADASRYHIYRGDVLVQEVVFNGNDSERAWYHARRFWHRSGWHYVNYPDETPYQLYRDSDAEVVVVDEELRPMQRPTE